jgi:hypothetical protein
MRFYSETASLFYLNRSFIEFGNEQSSVGRLAVPIEWRALFRSGFAGRTRNLWTDARRQSLFLNRRRNRRKSECRFAAPTERLEKYRQCCAKRTKFRSMGGKPRCRFCRRGRNRRAREHRRLCLIELD